MKSHPAHYTRDDIENIYRLIGDRNGNDLFPIFNNHLISLALAFPFSPSHSVPLPPVRNTLQSPYP